MKRQNINRYFFPDEWVKFIESFPDKNKRFIYETLLISGARIEEALHIKANDFDFSRNVLTLQVTKIKAKKKEKVGKKRSFVVSSEYMKKLKSYINNKKLASDDYLFINQKDFEKNFKNRVKAITSGLNKIMKTHLNKIKIEDYFNFSLHNIRKTHGMWLKCLILYSREITEGEICLRLGHDMNTYLKHYGSPSIFNERDKKLMMKLLGDIYGLQ